MNKILLTAKQEEKAMIGFPVPPKMTVRNKYELEARLQMKEDKLEAIRSWEKQTVQEINEILRLLNGE